MSRLLSKAAKSKDPAIRHLFNNTLSLAKEVGAPAELIASIEKCLDLSLRRVEFEEDTTTQDSKTCRKITEATMTNDWPKVHEEGKTKWNCSPHMISGRVESQFLKSFLSAVKAKEVLEVGMFTGYTAISIAESLPADGKVTTLDQDDYLKDFVRTETDASPHKNKIDIVIGQAIENMEQMVKDGVSFDAVFLDAAKSEYETYMRLCFDGNLLRPNGTILVDNAYMGGSGYCDPESPSAKFAQTIMNDPRLHVVLVPIKDGIFMIRRREEVDGGEDKI